MRILTCRSVNIDQGWNHSDLLCTLWRLYINETDGAELVSGNQRHYLHKNKMYIIPAWQKISMSCSRPLKHFYVHFDLIGMTEYLCGRIFEPIMEFERDDFEYCHSLLETDYENPFHKFTIDLKLKSLIYELLYTYLDNLSPHKKSVFERFVPAAGRYSSLFEYIDRNLNQKIENRQLAEFTGKSPGHFIREFTTSVGITPAKFVTQRRISRALEMLIFSERSIDQIAYDTGFTDRFHFSKVFKKITGTTPAAYKKQIG